MLVATLVILAVLARAETDFAGTHVQDINSFGGRLDLKSPALRPARLLKAKKKVPDEKKNKPARKQAFQIESRFRRIHKCFSLTSVLFLFSKTQSRQKKKCAGILRIQNEAISALLQEKFKFG